MQLVAEGPPRKEDVMISLLKMTSQRRRNHRRERGAHKKKPRDLVRLILEMPAEDKN